MRVYETHQEADLQIAMYTVQSEKVEQIYFQLSSQGRILLFTWLGARFQIKGDQKPVQKW